MKLKNCNIGTAVQSKTTGLTGVIFDIWYDEGDNDVEVHFNSYTDDGVKIVKDRVKPESLRKVKSVNENGGKERVCIIVKNSGVNVNDALCTLSNLGYDRKNGARYGNAVVLYGEKYGGIEWVRELDYHYEHCAHLYRDITNEVGK